MGNPEDIERIASDWLARRDRGELTADEERAFNTWLNASTEHRVSFLRLDAAWTRMDTLTATGLPSMASPEARPESQRRVALQRIAAALAVVILGASGLYVWDYQRTSFTTEVGGLAAVPLNDGSRVTLNTATELRVRLSDRRRRVDLSAGEAFFEVTPDPQRPFVVTVGKRSVEVVGTRFAVRRDDEALSVLVVDGHVKVHEPSAGEPYDLVAGDRVDIEQNRVEVSHHSIAALESALSWRNGMLVFRDEPLHRVVEEFNRYSRTRIALADDRLRELRIGGAFRTNNQAGFVRLLESGFDVKVESSQGQVLLYAPESIE